MLIIINIIILIHSTKKKLQKLFKKFSYGLFKLIYGGIHGYQDINKTPGSEVIISEINKDFRYKIYIVKKARLYTDTINDTAVLYGQKIIKGPSFQIRNTNFSTVEKNIVFEKGTPRFQKKLMARSYLYYLEELEIIITGIGYLTYYQELRLLLTN